MSNTKIDLVELNENASLYELQDNFDSLSTESLNKIYDYFCENIPLFKELSEQMDLSKEDERVEFLNELYYIYKYGANTGSNGLIYCYDMERFYNDYEDEMLDYLDNEASDFGCKSKMEYLTAFLNCDLEDYKWKVVQSLAYTSSIRVMETTLSELNLKNNNSQELVDSNKPKIHKR